MKTINFSDKRIWILLAVVLVLFSTLFFLQYRSSACDSGDEISDILCWEEKIAKDVSERGVEYVFKKFNSFYNNSGVFARNCHGMMHIYGESAYELHTQSGDVLVYDPKMTECGYGFLHGYVDKLISGEEDGLKEAGLFCEELGKSQTNIPSETIINDCFHGIGHGVIDDERGYGSLTNLQIVLGEALELCQGITESKDYAGFCLDGAFHSTGLILMENPDLPGFDRSDPFYLCRQYGLTNSAICHGSFASLVMALNDDSLMSSLKYLGGIQDNIAAETFMRVVTAYRAFQDIDTQKFDSWIEECRTVPEHWFDKCINGLTIGLMDFSGPGEQSQRALSLCQHDLLSDVEQKSCTSRVIERTRAYLGEQEYEKVCNNLNHDFPDECE